MGDSLKVGSEGKGTIAGFTKEEFAKGLEEFLSENPEALRNAARMFETVKQAMLPIVGRFAELQRQAFEGIRPFVERFAELQRQANEERRKAQDDFLAEQIAAVAPAERPSPTELKDLERRLDLATGAIANALDAIEALEREESFPGRELVQREADALWKNVEEKTGRPFPLEERKAESFSNLSPWQTGWYSLSRVAFAFAWPKVWHEWRNENAAKLGFSLALVALEDDPEAVLPHAQDRLRGETARALKRAQEAIGSERTGPLVAHTLADEERDGMLAIDADAADWLAKLDPEGAEEFRSRRRKAFTDWRNAPNRDDPELSLGPPARPRPPWEFWFDWVGFARGLALVLWEKKIKPELERERYKYPSVPLIVASHLPKNLYLPGRRIEVTTRTKEGSGEAKILDAEGRILAETAVLPARELEAIQRGAKGLGRLPDQRVFRAVILDTFKARNEGEAQALSYVGGREAFAERCGERTKQGGQRVMESIRRGQAFRFSWPGGEIGGLWTYSEIRAARGRRAVLTIEAAPFLRPNYVFRLKPWERPLVPIVEEPPFIGRENEWVAQAAFQFEILLALAEQRLQLVEKGGALLPPNALARLAQNAGLPASLIPAVIDRWTQDGTDGPAVLERVEKDRFHLANNATYGAARAFLDHSGRLTKGAQEAGELSAEKRRSRRLGKSR